MDGVACDSRLEFSLTTTTTHSYQHGLLYRHHCLGWTQQWRFAPTLRNSTCNLE
jgi:hypothetical protein